MRRWRREGYGPDGINLYNVPSMSSAVLGSAATCFMERNCVREPEANLS